MHTDLTPSTQEKTAGLFFKLSAILIPREKFTSKDKKIAYIFVMSRYDKYVPIRYTRIELHLLLKNQQFARKTRKQENWLFQIMRLTDYTVGIVITNIFIVKLKNDLLLSGRRSFSDDRPLSECETIRRRPSTPACPGSPWWSPPPLGSSLAQGMSSVLPPFQPPAQQIKPRLYCSETFFILNQGRGSASL
jgi:hypothetical protein